MFLPWVVAAVAVVLVVLVWALNYKKARPSQVLVVSGRSSLVVEPDGQKRKVGCRLQVGKGTLVLPFAETVDIFALEVQSITLRCGDVLTAQGQLPGGRGRSVPFLNPHLPTLDSARTDLMRHQHEKLFADLRVVMLNTAAGGPAAAAKRLLELLS